MGSPWRLVLLFLVFAPALAGCRTTSRTVLIPSTSPILPTVPRQLPAIDVSAVSVTQSPSTGESATYHSLTLQECQRLACEHSSLATLIERAAINGSHDQTPTDCLRLAVAAPLARDIRNRTVASALELYFQLLEAELLTDALLATTTELDTILSQSRTATDAGIKESPDLLALQKQAIELRGDQARLRSGIDRLNAELKGLLRLETTPGRLSPVDPIRVPPDLVDADQAVRIGLASRADLDAIRVLIAGLDTTTLGSVRQAVAGLVPPMAAMTAATRVLAPGLNRIVEHFSRPEVEDLRGQLQTYLAEQEREIAKDIRTAVLAWHGARDLVAIAKQRTQLELDRQADLAVKRQAGVAVEAEWRRSKLEVLRAEADLIREAARWQQADVRVRREMGILAR